MYVSMYNDNKFVIVIKLSTTKLYIIKNILLIIIYSIGIPISYNFKNVPFARVFYLGYLRCKNENYQVNLRDI